MKKTLLLPVIFFCFSSFAQKTTKQQDVYRLLTTLQMKAYAQEAVNKIMELYKKQKPTIPQPIWNDIKNSVDYNSYMVKIAEIFNTNYTQPELELLIKSAIAAKPRQPKFKATVQKQLYEAGKAFGQQLASSVQSQLKAKGF